MSIAAPAPSLAEGLSSVRSVAVTSELEDLFQEHHQLIYRTAYSVTGSRPDSEDVLQVIFLRLLRRGLPPDLLKNPKGYLYRAAINVSLNTVRDRERRKTDGDGERLLTVVEPAVPPEAGNESRGHLLNEIGTAW